MLNRTLSIALALTLGAAVSQPLLAATPPVLDGQDTCLIGEKIVNGATPVEAMLDALANCDASIENVIREAIIAAPHASAELVAAAINASPDNALLIVQTAMAHAPSEMTDEILTIALESGIDPADILQATAAGVEDTTETTDTTVIPTTTDPIAVSGGVSAS